MTLQSVTLSLNQTQSGGESATGGTDGLPGSGGGLFSYSSTVSNIQDSLFAENVSAAPTGSDIAGVINSLGNNLIGAVDGSSGWLPESGDLTGSLSNPLDPILATLAVYGGPTPTMPPLRGSPAIDAGSGSGVAVDQRGLARPQGAGFDIGAVESNQDMVVINTADSGPGSLREALAWAFLPDTAITFAADLSGGSIVLQGTELTIDKSLTIDASALSGGLTVSGNAASRVFNIMAGAEVELDSLTIADGFTGAGVHGAGLKIDESSLTARNCTFSGNHSGGAGALCSVTRI